MAILSVNGVELPVLLNTLSISSEEVGEVRRNVHGFASRDRRAVKLTLECELAPKSLDEAMLFRALVLGEGEFWSLSSSVYGSKGLSVTGTGSHDTSTGSRNPRTSTGTWKLDPNETMILQTPGATQSAVAGNAYNPGENGGTLVATHHNGTSYRLVGLSWRHDAGGPTVLRERLGTPGSSGAAQGWTGGESFGVTTTTFTATAPGSGITYWSNLLWLPRYFPTAQVDALLAGYDALGFAAPDLPRVLVETDLFPGDLVSSTAGTRRAFVALGEVDRLVSTPHYIGGTFSKTALGLTVRLVEV